MKLVVFGLSLSSSWGNGHATTYRALLRAFAARGHEVVFYEWDAPWYRDHRDLPRPGFCRLVLYSRWSRVRGRALGEAREADATLVGSYVRGGPAVIDSLAGAGVSRLFFYDIDTPVTVAGLRRGACESLRRDQVPLFQTYFSFTGGPFLQDVLVGELRARRAHALYCAVDPDHHVKVAADTKLRADLAYMGTYAPDRQPKLERLLLAPARRLPRRRFLVAGAQYPSQLRWPRNVRKLTHVPPGRHAAFYSSAGWQLNLTRSQMVQAGWSPSVRLFEAAACSAAILSDAWPGLESFFEPGTEILLPTGAGEVLEIVTGVHADDRRAIGAAARRKVLGGHTSEVRAEEFERYLQPWPTCLERRSAFERRLPTDIEGTAVARRRSSREGRTSARALRSAESGA